MDGRRVQASGKVTSSKLGKSPLLPSATGRIWRFLLDYIPFEMDEIHTLPPSDNQSTLAIRTRGRFNSRYPRCEGYHLYSDADVPSQQPVSITRSI
jgi:hypothetical protein